MAIDRVIGPVLDKELRVSSRRRRNYVLRSAYVLVLVLFIFIAWARWTMMAAAGVAAFGVSRQAQIGTSIILTVTWFRFIAAQLIAVVMLINSVSDEVRRGTLAVLMSTPINSLQIVLGKLLSSLLQLFGFIAISLSTLAVVRVFGGVQWQYIVESTCITLTAVLFAASLSLFFSISARKPYSVIVVVLIILVMQYGIVILSYVTGAGSKLVVAILGLANPFAAMFQASSAGIWRMATMTSSVSWPWHCTFMFGLSIAIIIASVFKIRTAMLAAACAPTKTRRFSRLRRLIGRTFMGGRRGEGGGITESHKTSPLLWKELGRPFWPPSAAEVKTFIVLVIILVLLYGCYAISFRGIAGVSRISVVAAFAYIFSMAVSTIVTIRTSTMAAVSISAEREARTWSTLLGTPVSNRQIVRDKVLAVIAKNRPGWAVMLLSPVVSMGAFLIISLTGSGYVTSVSYMVVQVPVQIAGVLAQMLLLTGAGLYFSWRLKSSTAAVIATISAALGLYFFQYFINALFISILVRLGGITAYYWVSAVTGVIKALFLAGIGVFLIFRTARSLRKRVFV